MMSARRLTIVLALLLLIASPLTEAEESPALPWAELPAVKKATQKQKALWQKMAKTPRGLFFSGRYNAALAVLKDKASPTEVALAGDILNETGRDKIAIKRLTAALKKHPDNAQLLAVRARAYAISGQYIQAETDLKKAVADLEAKPKPGQMRAKALLGELYMELARRDDWFAQADWFFDYYGAEVNNPADLTAPEAYYLGRGVTLGEDFKNGLLMASRAEKKDPTFIPAFLHVGRTFAEKYQYGDAVAEFQTALKINPRQPDAWVGIASLQMVKRKFVDAEKSFRRALKTNPRHLEALLGLAQLEFVDENNPAAFALTEKVLAVNSNDPDALIFMAALKYVGQNKAAAKPTEDRLLTVYRMLPFAEDADDEVKAAAINTGKSRLMLAVSQMFSARLRVLDSLPPAREAVTLDNENFAAQTNLGIALMRHGMEKEAEPVLKAAFGRDPFNVWLYNLRQILRRDIKEYAPLTSRRFIVKLHKDDAPILSDYLGEWVDKQLEHCEAIFKYDIRSDKRHKIGKIKLTIMKSHADFSARITGLPNIHATGATFGPFMAIISPRAMQRDQNRTYNWESTTLHEVAHVVTLMGSRYRIPRWLTEGISVYVEGWVNPGWDKAFKTMVENEMLPDIAHWNRDFNRPKYGWQVAAGYHAAGKFVGWLVAEHGTEVLPKILQLYAADKTTSEVFLAATGKDIPALNAWLHKKLIAYAADIQISAAVDPSRLTEYEKTYEKDPAAPGVAYKLLRLYQQKRSKKLPPLVEKLLKKGEDALASGEIKTVDKSITAAALIAALQAFRKKRFDRAKKNLKLALATNPKSAGAHFLRAIIAGKEKDLAAAELHLRKTIKFYPRFVQAHPAGNPYKLLVGLLDKREKPAEAIAVLEIYCRINRDDGGALRSLAERLLKAGREAEALAKYRQLIGIDPYSRPDHEAYGKLLTKAGRTEEAAIERRVAKACPAPKKDEAEEDDTNKTEPKPKATQTPSPAADEKEPPTPTSEPEKTPPPKTQTPPPATEKHKSATSNRTTL